MAYHNNRKRRKVQSSIMKKVLVTLVFLLLIGGAAFFLGWAQFGVPPGSWGVLRSKTHGTDPEPIREGRIRWVWYKLIPSNVTVTVFKLDNQTVPLEVSGTLPSGDVYSALAGLKADFSYRFSLSLSFRLRGESLPALAGRENLLDQEDLDRYITRLSGEMENRARTLLLSYGENEKSLEEARSAGTIRALETELQKAFPDTENISCTVKTLDFPDFILYGELRNLYRDYLAAQRDDMRGEIGLLAAETLRGRRRFEELSNYGELLTKYPLLLQYLALEKGRADAD
jgi:hypothetical protein